MKFFNSKEKKEIVEPVTKPKEEPKSESSLLLQKLCKGDTALYQALKDLIYHNPELNKETCEEAMEKADASREILNYRHATSLALYRNNLDYFIMALNKYTELAGPSAIKFERAREVPETALEIGQTFYKEWEKIKSE